MIRWRGTCAAMLALMLAACTTLKGGSSHEPPTKGVEVHDIVYLPVDRATPPPDGYALYTVLLTRTANPKATRVMAELLATTGSAGDAAIKPENLNLITIPVKNVDEADRALASARIEADAAAAEMMQKHYDFDLAALLMASVCRPARGAAVMKVCGATTLDGPILVTSQYALGASVMADEKLLIVNLSTTPAGAIPEVLAAYRRQILRTDYTKGELDSWRLKVLNQILEMSDVLPEIRKAYAGLISP